MKGWLLVLGISWRCCGLLKLKFHSGVVFVCFFSNYFHYGDSVSEGKEFGRGLSVHAVLGSGSVICCDHLVFAYLQTFHICGVSGGEEMGGRRRKRVGKFRSHIYSVEWQWFSCLSLGITRAEPSGLGYLPLLHWLFWNRLWLCVHPGLPHTAQGAKSVDYAAAKGPLIRRHS